MKEQRLRGFAPCFDVEHSTDADGVIARTVSITQVAVDNRVEMLEPWDTVVAVSPATKAGAVGALLRKTESEVLLIAP